MDKLTWFTSSYSSGNGACVECARTHEGDMVVRDSKDTASALSFPREGWQAFLRQVRKPS